MDKVNNHGGSQRAGSQLVSGCSHSGFQYPQGSWGGGGTKEEVRKCSKFSEQQWGCNSVSRFCLEYLCVRVCACVCACVCVRACVCVCVRACVRPFKQNHSTLCCVGWHLNRLLPSVWDGMLLTSAIDWWLASNLGNSWPEGKKYIFPKGSKMGLENEITGY